MEKAKKFFAFGKKQGGSYYSNRPHVPIILTFSGIGAMITLIGGSKLSGGTKTVPAHSIAARTVRNVTKATGVFSMGNWSL